MSTPPAGEPFASLDVLRRLHQQMLERQAGSDTAPLQTIPAGEIAAFLGRAGATGALLADPEDRRAVQRILDYWSADLIAASRRERVEVRPVQLAPYAAAAPKPEPEGAIRNPEEARQYIRLSALARQWRDSGAAGYLLGGEALDEAERFARDPDIAALIAASRGAQGRTLRRRQRIKNVALAVLVAVIALLGWMNWQTSLARQEAEVARQAAEGASEREAAARLAAEADRLAARTAEAQARMQATRANTERLRAEESARQATQQWRGQNSRNVELDAALDVLARQVHSGLLDPTSIPDARLRSILITRLTPADTPDPLLPYALPRATEAMPAGASGAQPEATIGVDEGEPHVQTADLATPAAEPALTFPGYDPGFLGMDLPLPAVTEAQAAMAWNGGEPLPYFYYSIILDTGRRMAILSAANLDRLQSRALPRAGDVFRPDPRLDPAQQPDPGIFDERGIERGRLVGRADISWGPALPSDTAEAAAFVAQMTSHYPNLVPQFAAVNQQSWPAIEDWVRLHHNPAASRVTILSGPVFGERGGLPEAYWKIAVSAGPEGLPTVDAFLVPNTPASAPDPEAYRTSVEEIALLTGLGFPEALIAAGSHGARLAARVPELEAADEATRRAAVQDLADLLRDPEAKEDDKLQVVEALLAASEGGRLAYLSPQTRVNLLFVLVQVPAENWMREAWLPLTARARRLAAADAVLGPQAQQLLAALRDGLGLEDGPDQTVYLQFAGYTHDQAVVLRKELQALGWDMPREEQIDAAQGLNQVRYHEGSEADAAAARLLAADLRAAGHSEVTAVGMEIIRNGILEVWISPPAGAAAGVEVRRPEPAPRD
ncbi:hypothetical protein GI374_12160 [Paracoccus sp. S-4012]|uniref:DNA/RNA non-specific endonuclease n=1 Tax=Paracoccus sp. S-4012 TaxID=2665648 RepID=UPI0012B02268|nr:DNA/RNA non-specific endonuclease [Paracoccus sp. S-4012]MRX51189.1 hypothetical protein [Paracoccus sp. S-4012]